MFIDYPDVIFSQVTSLARGYCKNYETLAVNFDLSNIPTTSENFVQDGDTITYSSEVTSNLILDGSSVETVTENQTTLSYRLPAYVL